MTSNDPDDADLMSERLEREGLSEAAAHMRRYEEAREALDVSAGALKSHPAVRRAASAFGAAECTLGKLCEVMLLAIHHGDALDANGFGIPTRSSRFEMETVQKHRDPSVAERDGSDG
jgi:hypothetical protein